MATQAGGQERQEPDEVATSDLELGNASSSSPKDVAPQLELLGMHHRSSLVPSPFR